MKYKSVSEVYETYDYDKFKKTRANRGHTETGGIKRSKLKKILDLIKRNEYIPEYGTIKVNKDLQIIDGHHRFEALKMSNMPIRYEVIKTDDFNDVTKREYINAIYKVNAVNTAWTNDELFKAAIKEKAPLALIIADILEKGKGWFVWTDVLGVIMKDERLYGGKIIVKPDISTFDRPDLIKYTQTSEFLNDLKHFIEFNAKARQGPRRKHVLKVFYNILYNTPPELISHNLFKKAVNEIPDKEFESFKVFKNSTCMAMLIDGYNTYLTRHKMPDNRVKVAAISTALKAADQKRKLETKKASTPLPKIA